MLGRVWRSFEIEHADFMACPDLHTPTSPIPNEQFNHARAEGLLVEHNLTDDLLKCSFSMLARAEPLVLHHCSECTMTPLTPSVAVSALATTSSCSQACHGPLVERFAGWALLWCLITTYGTASDVATIRHMRGMRRLITSAHVAAFTDAERFVLKRLDTVIEPPEYGEPLKAAAAGMRYAGAPYGGVDDDASLRTSDVDRQLAFFGLTVTEHPKTARTRFISGVMKTPPGLDQLPAVFDAATTRGELVELWTQTATAAADKLWQRLTRTVERVTVWGATTDPAGINTAIRFADSGWVSSLTGEFEFTGPCWLVHCVGTPDEHSTTRAPQPAYNHLGWVGAQHTEWDVRLCCGDVDGEVIRDAIVLWKRAGGAFPDAVRDAQRLATLTRRRTAERAISAQKSRDQSAPE